MTTTKRARTRTRLGLLAATLVIAVTGLPGPGAASSSPVAGTTRPVTSAEDACQVVSAGRAGRAWLPWARVAVPGARLTAATVRTGPVRADVDAGHVLLQRTSRRAADDGEPVPVEVQLEVEVVTASHSRTLHCVVELDGSGVETDHGVRRVVLAG